MKRATNLINFITNLPLRKLSVKHTLLLMGIGVVFGLSSCSHTNCHAFQGHAYQEIKPTNNNTDNFNQNPITVQVVQQSIDPLH